MCVNVFLADDAEVMRNAIRRLLSDRKDIAVVGEASNFRETVQKTAELHPDLIILDLRMMGKDRIAPIEAKSSLNGAKVLAITFATDEQTEGLLHSVGAVKLLDKMNLAKELIPTILELAQERTSETSLDAT
jgi:DNA-binding NarL/FixJ family response regulator